MSDWFITGKSGTVVQGAETTSFPVVLCDHTRHDQVLSRVCVCVCVSCCHGNRTDEKETAKPDFGVEQELGFRSLRMILPRV